jgi:hypothetical protein
MWLREDVKERARFALKDNGYWKPVLASLILLLMSLDLDVGGNTSTSFLRFSGINQNQYLSEMIRCMPLSAWFWGVAALFSNVYSALVIGPLAVGQQRYFLEHRSRKVSPALLFRPFQRGYKNAVVTTFMTNLIVLLWTLLLIVPGVIKKYQYYFVPSILAENPDIPWRRAMRISRDMTQGDKMNIWVMELSFLGWSLLGLGVGLGCLFLSGFFMKGYDLYAQLRALTRSGISLSQFLGGTDSIRYVSGYVGTFLRLHLAGLILYYLFTLLYNSGQLFVAPYFSGAFADLYAVLRARALVNGLATREELPGFGWPDEESLEESMRPDVPPRVLVEAPPQDPPEQTL